MGLDIANLADQVRSGQKPVFEDQDMTLEQAQALDAADSLRPLRKEFLFPTKTSLQSKSLKRESHALHCTARHGTALYQYTDAHAHPTAIPQSRIESDSETDTDTADQVIYFCGNSLGLQSKATRRYVTAQLDTWASLGVSGHFANLQDSPLVNWQDMAADCARKSAPLIGALPSEIVYMNTLTTNIHLLLASFYRPTATRHKIILEWKPFPSDYYAISSHLKWHFPDRDPTESMVELWPASADAYIPTSQILQAIDKHAHDAALILLPGIQYYSGQFFDIPTITKYAHDRGLVVGWDLAHAAGNVDLRLHDWDVDFAMWCTYKYINSGPGSIAGAFVHERHGTVEWTDDAEPKPVFRPRLSGWYGGNKSVRFQMAKQFQPTPGAGGFQIGNPSALDLAALSGALSMFEQAGFANLRNKSLVLTAYAEAMLQRILAEEKTQRSKQQKNGIDATPAFTIISPASVAERGAQLSVLLREGLLDRVQALFEDKAIVCDKRKPDVIRVAPVPMYNSFEDVWRFMQVLREALGIAKQ